MVKGTLLANVVFRHIKIIVRTLKFSNQKILPASKNVKENAYCDILSLPFFDMTKQFNHYQKKIKLKKIKLFKMIFYCLYNTVAI